MITRSQLREIHRKELPLHILEQDLEVLLVNPPKYDDVKKEVVRALSEHGFEIS